VKRVLLSDEEHPLIWADEPSLGRLGRWALRHPVMARRAQDAVIVLGIWGVLIAAWAAGSSAVVP
jgi:hypothetical protein